ncbi:Glutathione S-transferase omega-like 2 [Fusarium oxysporum f. sp. cubense]|uniref:Glutathione S-transferase omega-like 2 n=1 Tax=Fusarium oxysporum f. sp. cubense TaxID=61366 RepID=A0A559KXM9_FUSOC|nr:Glutathione S-transferase omega-like 2 [Fusarium oxysporum f. sp. cubense]
MGDLPDEIRLKPNKDGSFIRPDSAFRSFVSQEPDSQFPAEKDRYALYLSPGCPWSHRAMIVRSLKKLENIIDLYICSLTMGKDGWFFDDSPEAVKYGVLPKDPLYGFETLKQLYLKANPNYEGRYTVPVLWDKKTHTMVNNESSDIIRMLYTEFDHLLPEEDRESHKPGRELYPERLRDKIDEINEWVYGTVNNGVYKTGFATSQAAYEENVVKVFKSLDRLEKILDNRPFLLGKTITEADIRLFPTILRFDVGYVPIFMCNLGTIRDHYPNLHLWLRRLYWDNSFRTHGAFRKTSEPWLEKYKTGYANARRRVLGITGPDIVPKGPLVLIHELEEGERLSA